MYRQEYQASIADPDKFWGEQARKELAWFAPFTKTLEWDKPNYKWFINGKLNITYNCLDRHVLNGQGNKIAYIYNNENNQEVTITYESLLKEVNKASNGFKKLGIKKGDRIVIYMPLCLEQIVLMLASARIGAIHSVVYAGFSAQALRTRIKDSQASLVCTSTQTQKNGKSHDLLDVVRQALKGLAVNHTMVHTRDDSKVQLQSNEIEYTSWISSHSDSCEALPVESSTPLFILYTSGTTGTPKGVVHGHGGYNLYTHLTMKLNFDLSPDDIHWTAADTGWITGHSYIVYGPLSNGVTSVIYEGSPTYPSPSRYWQLIEKYKVTSFYTAPTVIRLFMKEGPEHPRKHKLSSLKVLGSVGEPINPVAWQWYFKYIGSSKVPVIDTWWQTETGGHMLVTPPSLKQKPGKAGLPFLGVRPQLVDKNGKQITKVNTIGQLVITYPWPGALMTCWNNHDRFKEFWETYPNKCYFNTGDVALFDEDGYFTILGRSDDVINVSGVRVGTAEVENALVAHESVAEAAVVGITDEVQGEAIKAFVTTNTAQTLDGLESELKSWVREQIGYIAEPASIEFVDKLPKTRSGKILRRILKAKEQGLSLGDTSTLDDSIS